MVSIDEHAEERRNIRNMLRWIGGFAAWPGLTIGFVFLLDLQNHVGHFLITSAFGITGVALVIAAPRIAKHYYP